MPAITPPTPEQVASWEIEEFGPRKGEEPVETVEVDNNTCTRRFLVRWEHRYRFARWLVGYSQLWNDGGTIKLSRLMPQVHEDPDAFDTETDPPEEPISWPFTKVTEMRGHVWADEVPGNIYDEGSLPDPEEEEPSPVLLAAGLPRQRYERAVVGVLAEQVPYELASDEDTTGDERLRYIEYPASAEPSGEYLQLPGAVLKRVAQPGSPQVGSTLDGKVVPQNIGKIVPQEVFRVNWHRLPRDVWGADSDLYQRIFGTGESAEPYFGAINSTEFYGRPIGTVLFTGVTPYRSKSPTGVGYELMLSFEFTYKPSGWNWAFGFLVGGGAAALTANGWYNLTSDGTYQTADTVADGQSIYNARDLNDLFVVGEVTP